MSNGTADFVFNNTDTTKGDTFRKIQGTTTTETENVSDTTDENIGVVVDAINETLKDGALDEIYASMEKHSLKKDITIFAESLSRLYKEHGTIGDMAYLFNDGGANVITAIESIMDTTRYSVADSKEMLQNQPESDIINSKKSKVSKSVGEKNGIEQSGKTIKNDERHSEMQAKGKSETVQNRGVDRQDSESSEIQLHRHGNKSVSGRIEQIEHRQLEQLVETVEFQNLSRNIGDMISTKLYNELSENKYANDSRLANDECDFSEVVTYDMLVDADNELRTLFADEIAEYFNQNNSADVDSTGMTVLKIVLAKLKNSIVRNEKGQLIPLYHATDKDFDKFEVGDIGYHFGSYSQAHQLASAKEILENARFIKAYLNITKPLVIEHDNNLWNATQIVRDLVDNGIIDEEQGADLIRSTKSTVTKNAEIREILISKGYDGIIYKNEYESGYANSYIVFDDSQIIRVESEENANEQRRNDLLFENSGRGNNASARKWSERISSFKQTNKGKNAKERQSIAKELLKQGQAEEVIDGKNKYTLVNPEAYNDDMLAMVEEAKAKGIELTFFLGRARIKFDTKDEFRVNGIKKSGNKLLVRYDGDVPPQKLLKHETVHAKWRTKALQAIKNTILNGLSEDEKNTILLQDRYIYYKKVYKGNMDKVWQEFVADVMADMNEYTAKHIDTVADYWYGNESAKAYSPSTYDTLYDAYPFLKNINVKVKTFSDYNHQLGEYDVNTNTIAITDKVLEDVLFKSILLHEVQHAIQYYEGFDLGSSPAFMETYLRQQALFHLANVNDATFNQIVQQGTIEELDKYVDSFIKDELKTDSVEMAAEELYYSLHGEKEAFSTGDRIVLSTEDRREIYPDFGKGAIILKDAKTENINDGISKVTKGKSGSGFVEDLHRDFRRRMEEKTGNSNSRLDQNDVSYSLATDGIPDLDDLWDIAIKKYGTIPKGEKPARDINVPKKIADNKPVSRFARTMMEAGVTPEFAISEFEKGVLDGTLTHEVITNKKASDYADERIRELGFEGALNRWTELAAENKVGKKQLALGIELYNQCVNNRDVKRAMKIAAELASEATRAGQVLQACRMLKQMNADGHLYYLERSIKKINEEFRERLGKKYKDIELDEKLLEEYLIADSEEARDAIYDRICQYIADRIPATKLDKWNSWRYLAMLGNPRTHIRNIAGNAVFVPAIRIKNYVGAVLERVGSIKIEERTKSILKDKKAIEFAKKDFAKMEKILKGINAKYAITSDIEGKRRIFKTKWLEKWRLKNFDFLEKEDMWFLKMHYIDSLARIITARKLDVASLNGKMLDAVRAYAIKEAQAATYRDANSLADGLNNFQRKAERGSDRIRRIEGVLLEGMMPFKKAPMNIAKQGIMYSPIGIMSTLYKKAKALKNGEMFGAVEFIDGLAKGLTGTGIILLGYFLASIGMLSGGDDENEKKRSFDKLTGKQAYAINVFGKSYTIDWVTPTSLPLFVGATLYDISQGDEIGFREVVEALTKLPEPLLELSVFSGISDLFETAKYSSSGAVGAIMIEMATSYVLQALPTIGGQISRVIDGTKRDYYYVDKTKDVPDGIQRMIGRAASKIPFASYLFEPSVDEWGRVDTYGGLAERSFENFVSPGYYSEEEYTAVDKELERLYEKTGESKVMPTKQLKYFTEDKKQYYMAIADYTETKIIRGKESFKLVNEFIATNKYKKMSDEEKVNAISKCYEKAGKYAKEKMIEKVKKASGK